MFAHARRVLAKVLARPVLPNNRALLDAN